MTTFEIREAEDIDPSKFYHKQTGELMDEAKLIEIVEQTSSLSLERLYDRYGQVEKYYYGHC